MRISLICLIGRKSKVPMLLKETIKMDLICRFLKIRPKQMVDIKQSENRYILLNFIYISYNKMILTII